MFSRSVAVITVVTATDVNESSAATKCLWDIIVTRPRASCAVLFMC